MSMEKYKNWKQDKQEVNEVVILKGTGLLKAFNSLRTRILFVCVYLFVCACAFVCICLYFGLQGAAPSCIYSWRGVKANVQLFLKLGVDTQEGNEWMTEWRDE